MKFFKFVKWLMGQVEPEAYIIAYVCLFLCTMVLSFIMGTIIPVLVVGGFAVGAGILILISLLCNWIKDKWYTFSATYRTEEEEAIDRLKGVR